MKQLRLPIFNSKIKIYNLRIIPSEVVCRQVDTFKKEFVNLYGKQPLSGSRPHITIAAFRMNSKYEDLVLKVFKQLAKNKPFKLKIDGFGVFEDSKTLHLNIANSEALQTIQQEVKFLYENQLKRKLKSFYISKNAHMTISQTTGKKMLYESLQYFLNNNYSGQIDVNHLTLVSRLKYRTWDWEHNFQLSKPQQLAVSF